VGALSPPGAAAADVDGWSVGFVVGAATSLVVVVVTGALVVVVLALVVVVTDGFVVVLATDVLVVVEDVGGPVWASATPCTESNDSVQSAAATQRRALLPRIVRPPAASHVKRKRGRSSPRAGAFSAGSKLRSGPILRRPVALRAPA